jgi:hypothetical protein
MSRGKRYPIHEACDRGSRNQLVDSRVELFFSCPVQTFEEDYPIPWRLKAEYAGSHWALLSSVLSKILEMRLPDQNGHVVNPAPQHLLPSRA